MYIQVVAYRFCVFAKHQARQFHANLQASIYDSFMHTDMLEFHPVCHLENQRVDVTDVTNQTRQAQARETTNTKPEFSKWLKPMDKMFPYLQIQNTGQIGGFVTFTQLCSQGNRILGLH